MACLPTRMSVARKIQLGGALLAFCLLFAFLVLPALGGGARAAQPAKKSLLAFASEKELNAWLQEKKKQYDAKARRRDAFAKSADAPMVESLAPAPSMDAPAPAQSESESVTNVQTAGVDEGGIVKVHKNHLVILRRGRLFTVRVGDASLQPVDMQDAYAPGSSGSAWYDEMLISGDTVVVIGYSYSKRGSEIILFGIDNDGRLAYRSTYVMRSNDYYSSRNYASRLIGDTLIFYTPLYLNFYGDPLDCFPAAYRWKQGEKNDFKPIAPATQVFRTTDDIDPTQDRIALHTVTTCKIAGDQLDCSAKAVLGPAGREFYVAKNAVYVWTAPFSRQPIKSAFDRIRETPVSSAVFRLPLSSQEAPTAIKTYGSPIDQFSFLESADGYLNVLVRAEGPTPSMWASEGGSHDIALLRTPLRDFSNGSTSAPPKDYHPLPTPQGGASLQNRYIGDYLVYGAGQTWRRGREQDSSNLAHILKWSSPDQADSIVLAHRVDRIEALGKAPLLVGGKGGDLYFTVLAVQQTAAPSPQPWWRKKSPPPAPEQTPPSRMAHIADTFMQKGAAQGETRSHGFFYKPDAKDGESGLLGLPYVSEGNRGGGWEQLKHAASGVIFLQNNRLRLSEAGALTASSGALNTDDQCKASCTDWYGNSRPLFVANRVFALMGYEIVEGEMVQGSLKEARRINFFQFFQEPVRRLSRVAKPSA